MQNEHVMDMLRRVIIIVILLVEIVGLYAMSLRIWSSVLIWSYRPSTYVHCMQFLSYIFDHITGLQNTTSPVK